MSEALSKRASTGPENPLLKILTGLDSTAFYGDSQAQGCSGSDT